MSYLHDDKEKFGDVVTYVAQKMELDEWIVEKDYYVTMVLRALSERFDFVVFKGGTSL